MKIINPRHKGDLSSSNDNTEYIVLCRTEKAVLQIIHNDRLENNFSILQFQLDFKVLK